jgi:hypothetical protein
MVVEQLIETKGDLSAGLVPTASTLGGRYCDYEVATYREDIMSIYPIEYQGEKVLLNPEYMDVGETYPVLFSGHSLVAIKQQDGTIDFYYLD